jgi:hypothetical protein
MEREPHEENWWTRNQKIFQFIVTTAIAIIAVWIAIVQNQINGQLRDLEYFKFLQPAIGESINSSTWQLTLTNYGESPIYIDSEAIPNAKFPIPIKVTIFPSQSTTVDLHPFLGMYNLIPPQGSSTAVDYRIFMATPDAYGTIYMGQLVLLLDNGFLSNHFQIMAPIQNVYVQPLGATTFQSIYNAMGK